jgi:hypothetical protein
MTYRGRLAVAALALTVTGCDMLPLGPDAPPALGPLAAPIILQLEQPAPPGGVCQAFSTPTPDFPFISSGCFRKTGTPVTFTSAAVTWHLWPAGSGHPAAQWGLIITVPGAEAAALTAITTKSFHTQDPVAISISGMTWAVVFNGAPLTDGQFEIMAQSKNQALQLQRTLVPSD